jgi:phosphohistidine swiveling domain-containing protein
MPSSLYIYTAPNELTAPMIAKALAEGTGGKIVTSYHAGTWAGMGSPATFHMLQQAIAAGYDWYYADKAYFGRRDYFRLTRNAYQHTGISPQKSTGRRLRRFHMHETPWRKDGRHIILATHSEAFYRLHGTTLQAWLDGARSEIRKHSDRPMIITTKRDKPTRDYLRKAWCLVTYTSNAAVDAVMAGVPVFCTGQCAASAMGLADLSKIEQPLYPEGRMQWAAVLADNQFTLHELSNGDAWRKIHG